MLHLDRDGLQIASSVTMLLWTGVGGTVWIAQNVKVILTPPCVFQ